MGTTPIIQEHPKALWTALFVTVVGGILSYAIGGAALIVLAVLVAEWFVKSVGRLHDEFPRTIDVVFTLLAIAAAGGLIALVAWII